MFSSFEIYQQKFCIYFSGSGLYHLYHYFSPNVEYLNYKAPIVCCLPPSSWYFYSFYELFCVVYCRLANGAEYLFQARDDVEMSGWVRRISVQCDLHGSAEPSRSQTLPASGERKDEPKRRSFFTLKKK